VQFYFNMHAPKLLGKENAKEQTVAFNLGRFGKLGNDLVWLKGKVFT
jgi:hypothetical protein